MLVQDSVLVAYLSSFFVVWEVALYNHDLFDQRGDPL